MQGATKVQRKIKINTLVSPSIKWPPAQVRKKLGSFLYETTTPVVSLTELIKYIFLPLLALKDHLSLQELSFCLIIKSFLKQMGNYCGLNS